MSLSVVILTSNSQSNLESAIKSSKFADEILVIDDNSTDKTKSIATKHSTVFLQRDLGQDFAAQRNFALQHVKTDWALFLDSDEVVTSKLRAEILAVTNSPTQIQGFYVPRIDFFLGKKLTHGETAHIKLLRLAKTKSGKWSRSVHETWQIQGKTSTLSHSIYHYPHSTLTDFLNSINQYTTIDSMHRHPNLPTIYLQTISYPLAKFILNYFIRLGFLDGMPGLIQAYFMAIHSLSVRIKSYEKNLI